MDTAIEHRKIEILELLLSDVEAVNRVVIAGVQNHHIGMLEALDLRDKVSALEGKILSYRSELEKLDKDSPCLKCKRIKRG